MIKLKKQLVVLSVLFLSANIYSQILFEKGYFINNTNQKIECLIENRDSKYNPTALTYKTSEEGEKTKLTLKTVKEFGIYNKVKYLRFDVDMDRSSEIIGKISDHKNPDLKKEILFLKVLLEGKANLYLYEEPNLTRFFYSTETSSVSQLIFKSYTTTSDYTVGQNNRYKQQLSNDLKCPHITHNEIKKLEYKKHNIVRLFKKYNTCHNSENTTFETKEKKDLINFALRPGIKRSSLEIANDALSSRNAKFDNELNFRIGAEIELIMPYNKNKWALIVEPTYQYYKSEIEASNSNSIRHNVDYKSIELPIGFRHYMFLNDTSKLFVNGSFVLDFSLDSFIGFNAISIRDLKIKSKPNFAFGFGYKYDNRYVVEIRYDTKREILKQYTSWYSNYNSVSLIFGYSLF